VVGLPCAIWTRAQVDSSDISLTIQETTRLSRRKTQVLNPLYVLTTFLRHYPGVLVLIRPGCPFAEVVDRASYVTPPPGGLEGFKDQSLAITAFSIRFMPTTDDHRHVVLRMHVVLSRALAPIWSEVSIISVPMSQSFPLRSLIAKERSPVGSNPRLISAVEPPSPSRQCRLGGA
jgi:hypothetical protein